MNQDGDFIDRLDRAIDLMLIGCICLFVAAFFFASSFYIPVIVTETALIREFLIACLWLLGLVLSYSACLFVPPGIAGGLTSILAPRLRRKIYKSLLWASRAMVMLTIWALTSLLRDEVLSAWFH